jgi:hypothetical protein
LTDSAEGDTRVSAFLVMSRNLGTGASIAVDCGVRPAGNRTCCLIKGCNDGMEMERFASWFLSHTISLLRNIKPVPDQEASAYACLPATYLELTILICNACVLCPR